MSKRPLLHVIEGRRSKERGIYRLRDEREQHAPVEKPWPKAGEWRDLVRALVRNPVTPRRSTP